MSDLLFNSFTDAIPPIRFDIQRISVEQEGQPLIYFYDQLGYATPNFAVPAAAEPILSLIDGSRSVQDIINFSDDEVTKEQILEYVQFLDGNGLLDSAYFSERAEEIEVKYEQNNIHSSITAGSTYPADPTQLNAYLNDAFDTHPHAEPVSKAHALYAPHIDPRVGMSTYVKAFSAIKNLKPKRVVVLATSHYAGLYGDVYDNKPFILSSKDYEMPNGTVKTHREAISLIKEQTQHDEIFGTSFVDRAFRVEHSIELHLLFLNHLWDHDFEIIPILVGGFDELLYHNQSFLQDQIKAFTYLLNQQFNDEDTFYLISGDQCHVGKKFGDQKAAKELFSEVENFDSTFLDHATSNSPKQVVELMKEGYDPYRVCGFPPLLTYLNAFSEVKGTLLDRSIWDEERADSAVSYASILFT